MTQQERQGDLLNLLPKPKLVVASLPSPTSNNFGGKGIMHHSTLMDTAGSDGANEFESRDSSSLYSSSSSSSSSASSSSSVASQKFKNSSNSSMNISDNSNRYNNSADSNSSDSDEDNSDAYQSKNDIQVTFITQLLYIV